jgi:hypothetical protein
MGDVMEDYRKALDMMDLSARVMEHIKNIEKKEQAEKDFQKTIEKLWPSTSSAKPS